MSINTLIFDLGGVLIDWNPEYVFQKVIPDEARRRYFFENICTYDWNLEQDAGRSLAAGTELLVSQHPDWEMEIRAYYDRWVDMLGEPVHGTVEILKNAIDSPNYRVYALTNWAAETWEIVLKIERFQFLYSFEGVVVSGQEKTRKPLPEIYQILQNRYEVNPQEAIFIDDNFPNVIAARALGMQAIHFKNPEQLMEELKRLNVSL